MKHWVAFLLAGMLICGMAAGARSEVTDVQNLVFYEIFTGSFSDGDGDGVGDLRGVISRLDYLNDGRVESETSLGIQGIWLTPVFASPSYHKYDVEDYYSVDPAFGTMEDLERLIWECHARGIRLILDLPLNHTSRSHAWFRRFQSARTLHNTESPFYDWYICHEADALPAGHTCYALGSTEFYYEGNFSQNMPELNYDNPAVRQAALDIAEYYLEKGVDGFRFDAAKYIYFGDNARSVDFWQWYAGELRARKPDIWMVAEVWDSDGVTDLYTPAVDCFQFSLTGTGGLLAQTAAGGDVNRFAAYIQKYTEKIRSLRPGAIMVPFLSNHDMDRAAGYLPDSNGRARMAANLYILGPGAPFLYYGEEIGLKGSRGGANTDANRRLAMRWGDGDPVADPAGATYTSQTAATVVSMQAEEDSLWHYYRRLIALRKAHPEIARGSCQAVTLKGMKVGGFVSEWQGSRTLTLHNTGEKTRMVDLEAAGLGEFRQISGCAGLGTATLEEGVLTLDGQTSVILRH